MITVHSELTTFLCTFVPLRVPVVNVSTAPIRLLTDAPTVAPHFFSFHFFYFFLLQPDDPAPSPGTTVAELAGGPAPVGKGEGSKRQGGPGLCSTQCPPPQSARHAATPEVVTCSRNALCNGPLASSILLWLDFFWHSGHVLLCRCRPE